MSRDVMGERSINFCSRQYCSIVPFGAKLQYDLEQLLSLLLNKMASVSAYSRTWPSCGRREISDSNDDDDEVKILAEAIWSSVVVTAQDLK